MHRLQQAITMIFNSTSHEVEDVRWRQKVLAKGHYDCGEGYIGVRGTPIKGCPFYNACKGLPAVEDVLCCLPDEAVGIDTTREAGDYFGG